MRLALAQVAAGPDRDANLANALDAMDRAADAGAEVVVFPELAIDRFFPQHGDPAAAAAAAALPSRSPGR